MTDTAVSLVWTPESKKILAAWSGDKVKAAREVIDDWLKKITAWMLRETMKAFDDGKQPGGSAWPPNLGPYAAWKASFGANKPGIVSGNLRRSFAQNVKINRAANEGTVGSTLPYARAFHYGSRHTWAGTVTGPGGRNPVWFMFHGLKPRPFFPEQKYGEAKALNLFTQLIRKKLTKGTR